MEINVLLGSNQRQMHNFSNSMNKLSPCKTPFLEPIGVGIFFSITVEKNQIGVYKTTPTPLCSCQFDNKTLNIAQHFFLLSERDIRFFLILLFCFLANNFTFIVKEYRVYWLHSIKKLICWHYSNVLKEAPGGCGLKKQLRDFF